MFVTLLRHERTSSSGQTKWLTVTPSSDSEAIAPIFLIRGPGNASLAPTCHYAEHYHAECGDRAACTADAEQTTKGLATQSVIAQSVRLSRAARDLVSYDFDFLERMEPILRREEKSNFKHFQVSVFFHFCCFGLTDC